MSAYRPLRIVPLAAGLQAGIKAYFDYVNANGGVGGNKVTLVTTEVSKANLPGEAGIALIAPSTAAACEVPRAPW
jgi:hypothetical protein